MRTSVPRAYHEPPKYDSCECEKLMALVRFASAGTVRRSLDVLAANLITQNRVLAHWRDECPNFPSSWLSICP